LTRIKPEAQPTLASRLNALLLVTKACVQDSCRNPWIALHPDGTVGNLKDGLDPKYDTYYASLPQVSFKECLNFQLPSNEEPFLPGFDVTAPYAFAQQYRNITNSLGSGAYPGVDDAEEAIPDGRYGAVYQDLATIEKDARVLTDAEIAYVPPKTKKRSLPYYG
jgi:N-acetylglucosamine-6-sulfatase